MDIIKSQYTANVVNYENKSILYYCYNCGESQHNCKCEGLDNNNKCHVCFTKSPCDCGRLKSTTKNKDKGKQQEESPNKRKSNDSLISILNTPIKKNKLSLKHNQPKTPKKNKSYKLDDIPEINNSFITNINNDNVVTSTQINSKSINTSSNSLERQNAFLYNEKNNSYVGEPPTSLDIPSNLSIPSTPNFDLIDDNSSENEIDLKEVEENFIKLENEIQILENDANKTINNLPDDQETYIPQFDGADDELIDEYNNIFKSVKQKYFIGKQFQIIFKINEYIKQIKRAYDNNKINEVTFIKKLKQLETKKQNIINQYELFKYKFPDNSSYKNIDICHYCKMGVLNQCSCTGEYINNIPAESFEENYNG